MQSFEPLSFQSSVTENWPGLPACIVAGNDSNNAVPASSEQLQKAGCRH